MVKQLINEYESYTKYQVQYNYTYQQALQSVTNRIKAIRPYK